MSLFDYDGPLFRWMKALADLVLLNITWLIFCLPIVTIGASTTALYHCTLKKVQKEEVKPFKDFLKAFKDNFKTATLAWLVILPCGILLVIDWMFAFNLVQNTSSLIFMCLIGIITVFYIMASLYTFPTIAKFNNGPLKSIKYAILIAIKNPWETIIMVAITICLIIAPLLNTAVELWFIIIGVSFGMAAICLLFSYYFTNVFKKYLKLGANDPDMNIEQVNR